ncbi:hypothetical protein ANCDUO_23641, partial [Ancylostoma duodenale]
LHDIERADAYICDCVACQTLDSCLDSFFSGKFRVRFCKFQANDVDSSATVGTADSAATEPMKEEADAQAAAKYKQTSEPTKLAKSTKKQDPVIGGYRTDEVYVYVRGRGRGRYVCDRCGIRCKKPSMLNKHIKFVSPLFVQSK